MIKTFAGSTACKQIPRHGQKEGEIMLLSNMAPILSEWISFSIPLFAGIAKLLTLSTMLVLMQLMYNGLSRLITYMTDN